MEVEKGTTKGRVEKGVHCLEAGGGFFSVFALFILVHLAGVEEYLFPQLLGNCLPQKNMTRVGSLGSSHSIIKLSEEVCRSCRLQACLCIMGPRKISVKN